MTNNITEAVENMLDTLENLTRKQKADENEELDMINSPAHYKLDGLDIESKDVLKSVLGNKGYVHWACGNAMKYIFRWEKKNGLEDLKKARKNLDFAIETLEGEGE
jgi:hypothetical protein|nr:MAG TPA: nucelotide kinase [Caudoviricetes sp.]